MIGRGKRLAGLEAMVEQVKRSQCGIVSYSFGLDDIALDDAIDAAIAAQGSHARRCVALPGKMQRADWIAMARTSQIKR
jgi:hypothetical protein